VLVNELLRDQSRELARKSRDEDRRVLLNEESIKLRREPVGGLITLRKYIEDDIKVAQNLIHNCEQTPLTMQQHNHVLGFLLSFICTEMPQVLC
jgi:hypothetical protein